MKNIFFALIIAAPGLCLAQSKTNYTINGKLSGVDSADMVYILHSHGNVQILDSAKVTNHTYKLTGFVEVGQQAMLMNFNFKNTKNMAAKGNSLTYVFVSACNFNILHEKSFGNIVVTGSPANEVYQQLTKAVGIATVIDPTKAVNLNKDKSWDVYGSFIKQHPKSPVAFYALKQMEIATTVGHSVDRLKLKPYFELLPQNIRESDDGKQLGKQINDAITFASGSATGSIARNFTLQDTAGRHVSLVDYKGKYVLVDFWASWCTPCRADNPHLVAAYNKFHSKNFDILSVSLDTKARVKTWMNAIHHDNLASWTHVADLDHDVNQVVSLYGVSGIPQNFLIGPNGKIIAHSLRGGELEKKLSELLHD